MLVEIKTASNWHENLNFRLLKRQHIRWHIFFDGETVVKLSTLSVITITDITFCFTQEALSWIIMSVKKLKIASVIFRSVKKLSTKILSINFGLLKSSPVILEFGVNVKLAKVELLKILKNCGNSPGFSKISSCTSDHISRAGMIMPVKNLAVKNFSVITMSDKVLYNVVYNNKTTD